MGGDNLYVDTFFAWLMTTSTCTCMLEKQILVRFIGIQKENSG